MEKYYWNKKKCLVCVKQAATSTFWDEKWSQCDLVDFVKSSNFRLIPRMTNKYLTKGSRILEGGCGRGDKVYLLNKYGYEAYGIDFAEKTVKAVNDFFPDMKVVQGDVFSLPYEDQYFDGYWSIGVIEHFYDGYEGIVREMSRVLKPKGVAFVSVPAISSLRKKRIRANAYMPYAETGENKKDFYQYILSPESVQDYFESNGFILKEKFFYDGLKGLKDEAGAFKGIYSTIYTSKNIFLKVLRKVINLLTDSFAGHCCLFVFTKTE